MIYKLHRRCFEVVVAAPPGRVQPCIVLPETCLRREYQTLTSTTAITRHRQCTCTSQRDKHPPAVTTEIDPGITLTFALLHLSIQPDDLFPLLFHHHLLRHGNCTLFQRSAFPNLSLSSHHPSRRVSSFSAHVYSIAYELVQRRRTAFGADVSTFSDSFGPRLRVASLPSPSDWDTSLYDAAFPHASNINVVPVPAFSASRLASSS